MNQLQIKNRFLQTCTSVSLIPSFFNNSYSTNPNDLQINCDDNDTYLNNSYDEFHNVANLTSHMSSPADSFLCISEHINSSTRKQADQLKMKKQDSEQVLDSAAKYIESALVFLRRQLKVLQHFHSHFTGCIEVESVRFRNAEATFRKLLDRFYELHRKCSTQDEQEAVLDKTWREVDEALKTLKIDWQDSMVSLVSLMDYSIMKNEIVKHAEKQGNALALINEFLQLKDVFGGLNKEMTLGKLKNVKIGLILFSNYIDEQIRKSQHFKEDKSYSSFPRPVCQKHLYEARKLTEACMLPLKHLHNYLELGGGRKQLHDSSSSSSSIDHLSGEGEGEGEERRQLQVVEELNHRCSQLVKWCNHTTALLLPIDKNLFNFGFSKFISIVEFYSQLSDVFLKRFNECEKSALDSITNHTTGAGAVGAGAVGAGAGAGAGGRSVANELQTALQMFKGELKSADIRKLKKVAKNRLNKLIDKVKQSVKKKAPLAEMVKNLKRYKDVLNNNDGSRRDVDELAVTVGSIRKAIEGPLVEPIEDLRQSEMTILWNLVELNGVFQILFQQKPETESHEHTKQEVVKRLEELYASLSLHQKKTLFIQKKIVLNNYYKLPSI